MLPSVFSALLAFFSVPFAFCTLLVVDHHTCTFPSRAAWCSRRLFRFKRDRVFGGNTLAWTIQRKRCHRQLCGRVSSNRHRSRLISGITSRSGRRCSFCCFCCFSCLLCFIVFIREQHHHCHRSRHHQWLSAIHHCQCSSTEHVLQHPNCGYKLNWPRWFHCMDTTSHRAKCPRKSAPRGARYSYRAQLGKDYVEGEPSYWSNWLE